MIETLHSLITDAITTFEKSFHLLVSKNNLNTLPAKQKYFSFVSTPALITLFYTEKFRLITLQLSLIMM